MLWCKKRSSKDFAEEIQSHLEHEAVALQESAEAGRDASAAARRVFGNVGQIEESFYRQGRWMWWDSFSRDLRYALRLFWRRPGFSAVVVLTLAVGIGANTAIFSVINAVLLRPLPYKEPNRLAMLWSEDSTHGLQEERVSLLNFADWKSRSKTFENMTFFVGQTFLLGNNGGPPERLRSARVPANFFSLLGVEPLYGRVFSAEEERRGEAVAVLSYGLWRRHFGGSPDALDQDLLMDGRKIRVVGVMPESFRYPFDDTQVWEQVTSHPYWASRDRLSARSDSIWYVMGRVRDGFSWVQAQSEMSVIGRQLAAEHPESRNLPEIRVVPLHTQTTGRVEHPLLVLLGSVFLVLLIACNNVASLLLARASAREGEFSVRRAVGAGRGRLVAQLLAESLVLSTAGALLGLGLAVVGLKALIAFGPHGIPRLAEARIDWHVLLFTLALSLFAALMAGLWPAVRTNTNVSRSRQWNSVAQRGLRSALVVGEISIALILMAGAGLMLRSFVRLQNVDPGFRPENLLVMRVDLHVGRTAAQQVEYFREAIERARNVPGAKSAAAISDFLRSDPEKSVEIQGRVPHEPGPCEDLIAGPFFSTAGIPLKSGRIFSDDDRAGSLPVGIVNETMARAYWPGEEAIGKQFRFPVRAAAPWITVVGVVGDMHRQGLETAVVPQVFLPHEQQSEDMMDVIVRTSADPKVMAVAVQSEIQAIDKSVARFPVTTVEAQLGEQTAERRFQTWLIGLFSVVALLLAAIGIYGLLHYIVIQRTNEIGVRIALGARYGNVLALVLRQGLGIVVVGIAIGSVAALGLTRMLSSLLFGVSAEDTFTFVAAPVVLLVVAAVACWVPAARAARIEPTAALRQQ